MDGISSDSAAETDGRDKEHDISETLGLGRPASPSLKLDTILVFDWDDTILPTSWLERIHALSAGGPLRPEVQRQIASLSSVAAQTLNLATSLGTVVIITNSAPGWVAQSCQLFMPQMLQQVRSYQTFAKPMHAPITFKINSFRRECRQFKNVISVGDGDAERIASLRLNGPEQRKGPDAEAPRHVKSVKLIELPTCQQLASQLEMLQVRLTDVVAFQGSLDLKSRFQTPGSALAAKAGACTLVHFTRPLGGPSVAAPRAASRQADESAKVQGRMALRSMPLPRSGQRGEATPPPGGQLPPLAPPHGPGTATPPAGGLEAASLGASAGDASDTRAAGNVGSAVFEEDRDAPRASSLWKVQGVGAESRGTRTPYHGMGKRRPAGQRSASTGAVWRDSGRIGPGFPSRPGQ